MEQLVDGIQLTKNNVLLLAKQALFLLKKKENASTALGVYSFAIEEWGKYLILNDHLNKSNYSIPVEIFGRTQNPHKSKFQRGLENIPHSCKNFRKPLDIMKMMRDGKSVYIGKPDSEHPMIYGLTEKRTLFPKEISVGDFSINFNARKECFYVDWDNERSEWKQPLLVSRKNLERSIKYFLEFIKSKSDSKR